MEKQTVLEVYKKISQRIENLRNRILVAKQRKAEGVMYEEKDLALAEVENELNWVRAELELTNEVNPN